MHMFNALAHCLSSLSATQSGRHILSAFVTLLTICCCVTFKALYFLAFTHAGCVCKVISEAPLCLLTSPFLPPLPHSYTLPLVIHIHTHTYTHSLIHTHSHTHARVHAQNTGECGKPVRPLCSPPPTQAGPAGVQARRRWCSCTGAPPAACKRNACDT